MNTVRPWALVTGASSGIGTELAVELARKGHDLFLTGRDASRLEAVASRVRAAGATAEIQALDLDSTDAAQTLVTWVGDRPLAVLVNNAGFGDAKPILEADPGVLQSMVALNITSLTLITRAFLPALVGRKAGRILNVASTAAFGPVPSMAVYAATKAYVLSFSQALSQELEGTGVTVTALCPGATATRFADRAQVGASVPFRSAMTAERVASDGVKALLQGRRMRTVGFPNQLLGFLTRFVPRSLSARVAQSMMAIRT